MRYLDGVFVIFLLIFGRNPARVDSKRREKGPTTCTSMGDSRYAEQTRNKIFKPKIILLPVEYYREETPDLEQALVPTLLTYTTAVVIFTRTSYDFEIN